MSEASGTIMSNRSFTFLAGSALVSQVGDQMTLIALPWLMLTLTQDPIAVSAMLALLALPRAALILLGGALADWMNPIRVLFVTRLASCLLLALLCMLTATGALQASHLYLFAFAFGLCGSVGLPVGATLLPRILPGAQLGSGNAMLMLASQLAMLIGPLGGGVLIAAYQTHGADFTGFSIVFGIDSLTFFVSVLALFMIRLADAAPAKVERSAFPRYVWDGAKYVFADRPLAYYFLYLAIITFFVSGPMAVGIPFLVSDELGGSALQYGSFFVALNFGVILAAALSMLLPALEGRKLIPVVLAIDFVLGALMIVFVNNLENILNYVILFAVGMMMGYVQITMVTRIQKRVDRAYLGRAMSYFMFALLGLVPVSSMLAGFIVDRYSAKTMFEVVGVAMILISVLFLFSRAMRDLGDTHTPTGEGQIDPPETPGERT